MTEYEIAEMSATLMGIFLTSFSVFLTVATTYLVAVYMAGNKLTTLQLAIVNGSYFIATSILGYLTVANFRVFYIWAGLNSEGTIRQSVNRPALIDFTYPIMALLLVIVIGSFIFMYSIRRGASTEPHP